MNPRDTIGNETDIFALHHLEIIVRQQDALASGRVIRRQPFLQCGIRDTFPDLAPAGPAGERTGQRIALQGGVPRFMKSATAR